MSSAVPASALSNHLPIREEWLAKNKEAILEPDLPIVDPHHHLIDRPQSNGVYLLPDFLRDLGSGHNIVATVYLEWLSMYRADGPAALRPVGEIEFANGVAAMCASGGYGTPRGCAGIVRHADLNIGAPMSPAAARAGASRVSATSRRPIPTRPPGAPWSAALRACCSTRRPARASPSSGRSA